MAKKRFRFAVTVGVHDSAGDHPGHTDHSGVVIIPARRGTRFAEPGEVVELEEAEGKAIIERHGAYVEPTKVDASVTAIGAKSEITTIKG